MKKGIIAMIDNELDYARNFMDYINQREEYTLETRIFSSISNLASYLDYGTVDILLIGDSVPYDDLIHKINYVITLTEGNNVGEIGDKRFVYKYQSIENIMKEIYTYCIDQGEIVSFLPSNNSSVTRILGVFSPTVGRNSTILALALGQAYAKNRKTLYINLEQFPGIYYETVTDKERGMSDLIYYLKQKKNNLIALLESMTCKMGNLHYIMPIQHYSDLYELNVEDIRQLLGELKSKSDFEVVILAMDFVHNITLDLLEGCEKVFLPTNEDVLIKGKETSFYHMLKMEEKDALCNNFIPVEMSSELLPFSSDYDIECLCVGEMEKLVLEAMV